MTFEFMSMSSSASAWAGVRGKPSKMAPVSQSGRLRRSRDHRDRHIVRDQLAPGHVGLSQFSQFGLILKVLPEKIAG
jgi:hypothetical protein